MALVPIAEFAYPGNLILYSGNQPLAGNGATLDAAGEYQATIFCAREAMTISHVGFLTTATGSPTVDVRIETVATDGTPSGALWATNTNVITGTITTGWTVVALTASASVGSGQMVCVKVVYNSGTSVIMRNALSGNSRNILPYGVTNTTGSPVKTFPQSWALVVGSSTTTFYYVWSMHAMASVAAGTFSNTVPGTWRGLRFQMPFACRCVGLTNYTGTAGVGDYNISLANDAGTELSSSSTAIAGGITAASTACTRTYFDNPVTLSAGTWYRLMIEPTTASLCNITNYTMPSSLYLNTYGWAVGTAHYFTHTTAAGYIDTATDVVPCIQPIIDAVDVSSGGAGGSFTFA